MSYYYKFIEHYPSVTDLASAPEEDVMKHWQGLGYYSRARNLHTSAKAITEAGGAFPGSYSELLQLKGIGQYTAAAVASFAYDEAVAVIDGNVYRVLARYLGIDEPIDSTEGKKTFASLAAELLDTRDPATHNQAIMEFGAMQCKPVSPDCSVCPLMADCFACKNEKVQDLPVKSRKTKPRDRFFNYLVINAKGHFLLNKRSGKDIWKNLYDFPLIESVTPLTREELCSTSEFSSIVHQKDFQIRDFRSYTHQLSHQTLHARFWEIELPVEYAGGDTSFDLVEEADLPRYAVPRLIEKYLEEKKSTLF